MPRSPRQYHNREVSYSSLLDLSITARQRRLYDKHGLDVEKWTEMGPSVHLTRGHSPHTVSSSPDPSAIHCPLSPSKTCADAV
jgi:hypothetical protein